MKLQAAAAAIELSRATQIPVVGLSPEGDDVALVTPPRKAARSLRRRPLTTMDVDATLECKVAGWAS